MNLQILRELVSDVVSGETALRQAKALYASDHWFSYRNFARTAEYVAEQLREIGLRDVRVDAIPAENRTRYSGWTTADAWDIDRGRLTVTGPEGTVLADWDRVPHHVIMRSESCAGVLPIVAWQPGDAADMGGKIAFTHARPAEIQHQLKAAGGLGIISDFLPVLPGVRSREEGRDHVLWEQVCFRPNPGGMWGFMISPRQGQWLEDLLARGPVTAEVDLRARCYEGVTHAIDAVLPADEPGGGEILLVAHLYEPGANDNASGAGLALEVLRALRQLQRDGRIRLRRSIRALLGYEGRGTIAWVHRHPSDVRGMVAGLNIDEIGVDQAIGRSTAHLFMPPRANPSFVGDVLEDLARRLLPAGIRWRAVGDRADIILDTRFSDPGIGVPTPCMIQYPAWTYHTSKDTPEVLSADVLRQFGILAAVYLLKLAMLEPGESAEIDTMLAGRAAAEMQQGLSPQQAGLMRERLEAKRRELGKWGLVRLPQLTGRIDELPCAAPASGPLSRYVLHRCTLAAPGGTQVADLLDSSHRAAFRGNLLNHGLDLVFHHFFYWADGQRTLEDVCVRIEDELASATASEAIPRTTTEQLTHQGGGKLDRDAVLAMCRDLDQAGLLRLTVVP